MNRENYYNCKKCGNKLPHHELLCAKCGFYNKIDGLDKKVYIFIIIVYAAVLVVFYFLGFGLD